VLVREVVEPRWEPYRLGRLPGGVARRRGAGLVRLTHVGDAPVVVAVAGKVFAARAASEAAAREGIARLRFATGIDDDLAGFHARFRDDSWLGRALRADPAIRVRRNPTPWEALMWAITEQLIDMPRALAIQRAMTARFGRRFDGLYDTPSAETIAAAAPAELEACGLHAKRALAMIRCAREVASGRVALTGAAPQRGVDSPRAAAPQRGASPGAAAGAAPREAAVPRDDRAPRADAAAPPGGASPRAADGAAPQRAGAATPIAYADVVAALRAEGDFARLLAIRDIGPWTVENLALYGLGRIDVVPAGDLGYLKLVGRLTTGRPEAIADEAEVRGFFAPFAPYAGLAASYLIRARTIQAPRPAGTRSSAGAPRAAAA
jgi:3-methyladenine DNA glycosylase/8-oxoguanine DNA glycosylase